MQIWSSYLIEYVPKHTGNHCFMVLKVDDLIMFVMVTLVENIRISVMLSVSFSREIYIHNCLFIIITSVCIIIVCLIVSTHTHIHTSGNPSGRFLVFRFHTHSQTLKPDVINPEESQLHPGFQRNTECNQNETKAELQFVSSCS